MRQIAVINQKGGVGKTTTAINLAAALVRLGRRVVVVDMDPQANLSLHVDRVADPGAPSVYRVLTGTSSFAEAVRDTSTPNLQVVPSNIDLSGAETELASAMGRETILGEAIDEWVHTAKRREGRSPADYLILDCPPSLGLLALNALATAGEVLLTVQTEFLALQGMSKLVEIVQLVRKRLNSNLKITGILPCMYDTRLRLAREVLGEIRQYFPGQVFKHPIGTNVKLAEAPSFGETIFQYAPESKGAQDYLTAAHELIGQESRDPELASLPREPVTRPAEPKPRPPAPAKQAKSPETSLSKQPVKPAEKSADSTSLKEAPTPTASPKKPQAEPESTPALRDEVLTPAVPPAPSDEESNAKPQDVPPAPRAANSASHVPQSSSQPGPQIVRAKNLPPLPRDAFDNYLDSMQNY